MNLLKIIFLIYTFIGSDSVIGQDIREITELDFEDLSKIKVTVASKQRLRAIDAPGFIKVFTASEIKALGYYTLAELANITPGFTSMYKFVGKQSYTVRGQRVPGNNFDNNKVLVLIDGIPMNHLRNGRAPMNEELPLDGIERVEFLKGPASALYGTNAFYGVINIISMKKLTEGINFEARSTFGSYGTRQNNVSTFFKNTIIEGKALATYSHRNSMALPWGDNSEDYRRSIDHVRAINVNTSLLIKDGPLKNFTLGYLLNGNRSGTWDNFGDPVSPTKSDTGYYNFENSAGFLKYKKELSKKSFIRSYLKRGWASEESRSYRYRQNFSSYEMLLEMNYELSSKSNLIFGLNYDQRRREGRNDGTNQNSTNGLQDRYVNNPSAPLRTYSGYLQYSEEFPLGVGLLTTFGLRYDRAIANEKQIEIDVSQFSPRLALVQKLSEDLSLKFIYGTAIRSPDLKAIGVANEAATSVNNPQFDRGFILLDAEKITSYDFGLTYEDVKTTNSFVLFYTVASNQIGREMTDITPTDPMNGEVDLYRNRNGDSKGYGLEYDFRYSFDEKNLFNFTAAWNMANLPDNELDNKGQYGGVPAYTTSMSYIRKWDRYSGSLVGYYIGHRRTANNADDPQNGFLLMDASLGYKLNNFVDISLWIRNLSNRDFRYSATGTQDTLSERGHGRSFFGSINVQF